MTAKINNPVVLLVRLALGGVFIYAGIIKIIAPDAFAGSIAAYRLLPYFGNYAAAATLPWIELLCGLLLVVNHRTKAASIIVIALNLVFIAALASTLVRGLDIDCGCFRQGGEKTSAWTAMARDALLLAAAAIVLQSTKTKKLRKYIYD